MTVAEFELLDGHTEESRVASWRFEALRRAGYDESAARELATRTDLDLHAAVDLVQAGCPIPTALRILL
jgi:hypothetical protein